jgi:hypothetical protein
MPKSLYYWSREEESKLLSQWRNGERDPKVLASHIGRKPEAVSKKLGRLGLVVVGCEKKNAGTTTIEEKETKVRLKIPRELMTVEAAMKKMNAAVNALTEPGLSKAEITRLRTLIQGLKIYKELFADFVHYLKIEADLVGLNREYERLAKKKNDERHFTQGP